MTQRILFDARCIQENMHGIARYALELLRHLPLESKEKLYVLYFPDHLKRWQHPFIHWLPMQAKPLSLQETPEVMRWIYRIRPHIFHSPSFMRPLALACPWIMTLHDLIHIHFPEDYGFKQRLYYQWLHHQLPKAQTILTVSEKSKADILQWCPQVKRVSVTPLGSSLAKPLPLQLNIAKPFILYIGNAKPHKNFELVFRAFEHWGPEKGYSLVAVGVPSRAVKGIYFYRDISDEILASLYHAADMVVVPSLYEGFGLPILETLSLGKTLIASDIPVFHEIAKSAAFYFNPRRRDSLISALETAKSLPDSRAEKIKAGLTIAQAYSWQKLGIETMKAYRRNV